MEEVKNNKIVDPVFPIYHFLFHVLITVPCGYLHCQLIKVPTHLRNTPFEPATLPEIANHLSYMAELTYYCYPHHRQSSPCQLGDCFL